jgi:hypothetical protein
VSERDTEKGMRVLEPPVADLVDIDGIMVIVRCVEIADTVTVRLTARRNHATDALDAEYLAAAWAETAIEHRRRGADPPVPPRQPGQPLAELNLTIADDAGTPYRCLGKEAGGTGTEWDATWRFAPSPPQDAREIRVVASDGDSTERALAL